MGTVLITAWASLASAEPPSAPPDGANHLGRPSVCDRLSQELSGYRVPGRKPDSEMPWEFFLGNASHQLIAYIYDTRYPTHKVYYNNQSIKRILREQGLGDWSLLSEETRELRPDILDINTKELFEIKPSSSEGHQDGVKKVQTYLQALNQTLPADKTFFAGPRFEGEVLIQFAQGQYIWRLEWCTQTPGVTQYLWTRTQQRLDSAEIAYRTNQWVEISEQELKKYGGWVAQAVEGMVERRERLDTFSHSVGLAIDLVGEVAIIILSTTLEQQWGAEPSQGKILPFPSKGPAVGTTVQLPRAAGQ